MSISDNIFFRIIAWFFDEFSHDEFDLKCPSCKLNNPATNSKCENCNYEFSELEILEQAENDRKRYYKNLTMGIIAATIFILIITYVFNKYFQN